MIESLILAGCLLFLALTAVAGFVIGGVLRIVFDSRKRRP